jgi:hypothetical protein
MLLHPEVVLQTERERETVSFEDMSCSIVDLEGTLFLQTKESTLFLKAMQQG